MPHVKAASAYKPLPVVGPHCSGCVNEEWGIKRVLPTGLGTSGLMIVGDSPWSEEVAQGEPFVGASGYFLNKQLDRVGLTRQEITITNSMWCKPPHLGWTDDPDKFPAAYSALKQCSPYLDDTISKVKPKCIVTLGNVPLRRICGKSGVELFHAYVHKTSYGIPAIPTFHPSHIIQGNHKLTIAFLLALKRARDYVDGQYQHDKFDLLLDPPVDQFRAYLNRAGQQIEYLMVDIETPNSSKLGEDEAVGDVQNIVRVSLSVEMGKSAVTVPWAHPYIQVIQEALSRAKWILFYNANFDVPRLRVHGMSFHDKIIDVMWLWHWYQSDLPKKLAFSAPFYYKGGPWKHLNVDQPDFYSAMDSAVQGKVFVGVKEDVEREGRWDKFMRHCTDVMPILVKMGGKGVLVDQQAKFEFFQKVDQEQAIRNLAIQAQVPEEVKPKKEYKLKPKDMEGVVEVLQPTGYLTIGGQPLGKPVRWIKTLPYNPRSTDQTLDLLKHFKIKPPKNKRGAINPETGEYGESADSKVLKKYMDKVPLFKSILEYRQAATFKSTFNWTLGPDGKVRTTFNFNPSTWRKGSANQNLMNIPKRQSLAKVFRKQLVASPGHVLMEGDSSAIEAVLVGFAAGSERLKRLCRAGIHGWVTAAWNKQPISIDLPFDELAKRCKEAKYADEEGYERNKRVVHLTHYKGTPEKMLEEYPDVFKSLKEASQLQKFYLQTEPGQDVLRWHQEVINRVAKDKFLTNHFQYKHYFYEATTFDFRRYKAALSAGKSKQEAEQLAWKLGDDAKRAIAFIPQSDASAIQTEILLALAQYEEVLEWLRLIIHDAIVLEVPEHRADWMAHLLHEKMTYSIPELNGESIGAEIKYGYNFAPFGKDNLSGMKEWHPPVRAAA